MKKIEGNTVKWGVVGVGKVCEVKSVPALQKVENSEVVAVMRRDEEKVKDYAHRHKIEKWYTQADDLINDPEVNAVYIATPPHVHAEIAIKVAQAGKPAYVEKPMAINHQQCNQMIKAFEKANLPLYVAYYRRGLPNFRTMKKIVEEGAIGDVRMVNIEMYKPLKADQVWRVDPKIAGGGYFYDLASHMLDYLDFLFGPITEVNGFSENQAGAYEAEDIVTTTFKFESGVLGVGSWCFAANKVSERDFTKIIGSKGHIEYETFGDGTVYLKNEDGYQEFKHQLPKHIQQPLVELMVNDLLGKGVCPSTGKSAARTNWVMEKITE